MIEKLKNYCDRLPYSPRTIAISFGLLTFFFRLPFIFRYDFFFGSDPGICYLMPLRILHGDRPFYFYSETHQGSTESYITALLFKIFGPSIPLAAAQSLLLWSIAVGLGVYLFISATSKFDGLFAGLVAAIGVPYTLIYVTVPYIGYPGGFLITMLVLLQAFFILQKGPTSARIFWFAFVIGSGLFIAKQCLPGVAAAFLTLLLFQTPAYNLRMLLRPFWWFLAVIGLLLGYWPEILYRATHAHYRDFSGLAKPALLMENLRQVPKALMAYFDAHPLSRIPTDVYFYHAIPFGAMRCANFLDVLFCVLGVSVLVFAALTLEKCYFNKNVGLFLIISLVVFNFAAVILSKESIGNFFNVRRYLHTSAISFSLLTGYFFTHFLPMIEKKWLRRALLSIAILFPVRAAYDQYALLSRPDGLRELRWVIQDMKQNGFNRGVSNYGPNYSINALSEEQIIIGNFDGDLIPEYADIVSQADKIAVIGYKEEPIKDEVAFNNHIYKRIGEPHLDELIRWIPYQKIQ